MIGIKAKKKTSDRACTAKPLFAKFEEARRIMRGELLVHPQRLQADKKRKTGIAYATEMTQP